ncbi:type III secretion system inner membrane ring subunit SctD [Endozoicomonas sp. Mp262]|uniref:type III secretion system inner membrane ring subunit SctD n=1 Tax=Endozoicomonas sp. Mp262 TaxID=2919499 RepID=UPI0021D80681
MNNSVWKLKILSGPHQGTELQLPCGKTTLGSDDLEADLVLKGSDLAPVHLLLDVTDQGQLLVSLMADHAAMAINGETCKQGTVEIIEGTVVSAGGVDLALTCGDHPWPELKPSRDEQSRSVPSAEVVTNEIDDKVELPINRLGKAFNGAGVKRLSRIIAIPVLLIIVSVFWFNDNHVKAAKDVVLSPLEKSQQLTRQLNLTDVAMTWNKGKRRVELTGYVNSKQDKIELTKQLKALGIRYKSRIKVMNSIIRSVDFALDEVGYTHIDVQAGKKPGTVLLTGTVSDRSRWQDLERILDNDIPGLKAWKVDFSDRENRIKAFNLMLAKAGLEGRLQLKKVNGSIKALGLLEPKELQSFYQAAEAFRQQYGYTPELSVSPRRLATGKLPVKGVNLGEVPFLVMADNQKYLVGAKLPNGYRIKEISRNGVTLSRGADTVFFSLDTYANDQRYTLNDHS